MLFVMTFQHITVPHTLKQTGPKALFSRVRLKFPDMSIEPIAFIFKGQVVIPCEIFPP